MIEIEYAVATPLEDLDLVVEPFHKTTILPADKVVGNFLPPVAKQFQEIFKTLQANSQPNLQPNSQPKTRVIKGGSFLCAPNYCMRYRAGSRQPQEDDLAVSHLGFRTIYQP